MPTTEYSAHPLVDALVDAIEDLGGLRALTCDRLNLLIVAAEHWLGTDYELLADLEAAQGIDADPDEIELSEAIDWDGMEGLTGEHDPATTWWTTDEVTTAMAIGQARRLSLPEIPFAPWPEVAA